MLRPAIAIIATACMTGCAQFASMTPQQKKIAAASIAGAVVLGYYANDGDEIFISNTYPPKDKDVIFVPPTVPPEQP